MVKELYEIQNELKCPKKRENKFGGFMFRNCEDIFDAVKPFLHKHSCVLFVTDDIKMVGDRFYVEATATLKNSAGESVSVSGYAREALSKKGMDESMVTGASSSYARKSALSGLFLLDDSDDPDAGNGDTPPEVKYISPEQVISLRDLLSQGKKYTEKVFVDSAKIEKLEMLEAHRFENAFKHITKNIAAE